MERMDMDMDMNERLVSGVMEDVMTVRYVRYVRKVTVIGEFNRTSDKLSTR
jgi:hypothetical protein